MVQGNFIGTDVTGTLALGNAVDGVLIDSAASSNTIGGTGADAANIIGFNTTGISISGSGNLIAANFVGTNSAGAPLGNMVGVLVGGPGNTIGGTSPDAANVIGLNTSEGILISGAGAGNNLVQGNFIGTNAGGPIWAIPSV